MIFATVPVETAGGATLAHSVRTGPGAIRKGTVLDKSHIGTLITAGLTEVTVARLESGDLAEDDAAQRIGGCLTGPGLRASRATTGRVNLVAEFTGLIRVDGTRVQALNAIDEGLTLATLADLAPVDVDQLVATVKIVPYGLAADLVARGEAALGDAALSLLPFQGGKARLILTRTPGFKDSLIDKGAEVVGARLARLGYQMSPPIVVPHDEAAVAAALIEPADLTLILGASATSDRADVAPAAVVGAGGIVARVGMPVDPGNLLFLGSLHGAPVVGLPGCARSPAMNGVDWVLERIAAGLKITNADISAMGVGGLLTEMPGRPHPRR